jgi:hypothetical protein
MECHPFPKMVKPQKTWHRIHSKTLKPGFQIKITGDSQVFFMPPAPTMPIKNSRHKQPVAAYLFLPRPSLMEVMVNLSCWRRSNWGYQWYHESLSMHQSWGYHGNTSRSTVRSWISWCVWRGKPLKWRLVLGWGLNHWTLGFPYFQIDIFKIILVDISFI